VDAVIPECVFRGAASGAVPLAAPGVSLFPPALCARAAARQDDDESPMRLEDADEHVNLLCNLVRFH